MDLDGGDGGNGKTQRNGATEKRTEKPNVFSVRLRFSAALCYTVSSVLCSVLPVIPAQCVRATVAVVALALLGTPYAAPAAATLRQLICVQEMNSWIYSLY